MSLCGAKLQIRNVRGLSTHGLIADLPRSAGAPLVTLSDPFKKSTAGEIEPSVLLSRHDIQKVRGPRDKRPGRTAVGSGTGG
jgi:hypothetical protein